jgi:hypothetical protein
VYHVQIIIGRAGCGNKEIRMYMKVKHVQTNPEDQGSMLTSWILDGNTHKITFCIVLRFQG